MTEVDSLLAARGPKLAATSDPLHPRRNRNNTRLVPHIQQPPDRFPAVIPVVEGSLVDVHADEFVGELGIEVAGELHGIGECFVAMINCILDAVAQRLGNAGNRLGAKRSANRVSAERQGQAGYFLPPLAQIDDALQSRLAIRQLAFVNDESSFVLAFEHLWDRSE